MRRIKGPSVWSAIVICVTFTACLFPDEISNQLGVQIVALPPLFEGDRVEVVANLVDQSGAAVPNAALKYQSSDETVVSVSARGALTAIQDGQATLTISAVGFEKATSATMDLVVHDHVEIDSIVPAMARFGQEVSIYGAGLDSIFQVTFGNVAAYVTDFTPADAAAPERFGRLKVLVMPPSPPVSLVQVTSYRGVSIAPQALVVVQRDILEPNDTTPQALPLPFANPGMAFEPPIRQNRNGLAFEWYTVNMPAPGDLTLYLTSAVFLPGSGFTVWMTDDATWTPGTGYGFAASSWVMSSGLNKCGANWTAWGADNIPFEEAARFHVSMSNVPAGTYHLLVDYSTSNIASPGAYTLAALNSYTSVRPRDRAEENDQCNTAAPLWPALAAGSNYTIDNPHDRDWFKFNVGAGGELVALGAIGGADSSDIDMYVVNQATDLVAGYAAVSWGSDEVWAEYLPAGSYYLLVADYLGKPEGYSLGRIESEVESNNSFPAADVVTLDPTRTVHVSGTVTPAGDYDVYAFYATAGDTVEIDVEADYADDDRLFWDFPSTLDSYLELYDEVGNFITANDDAPYKYNPAIVPLDSRITYVIPTTGWYHFVVWDLFNTGGFDYFYVADLTVNPQPVAAPAMAPTNLTSSPMFGSLDWDGAAVLRAGVRSSKSVSGTTSNLSPEARRSRLPTLPGAQEKSAAAVGQTPSRLRIQQ